MSSPHEDPSFSESHLESAAYRQRLLRKLNTLIAVLEVACAKVRRTLKGPDPDVERLVRIHGNLKETLAVCRRAKRALERHEELPDGLPPFLADAAKRAAHGETARLGRAPARDASPETTPEEEARFAAMGPITTDEVRAADLDELCQRLLGG